MKNMVWVVLWGADEGYSDSIRVFSTKEKVYNYIYAELTRQKANFDEYDDNNYYIKKYERLIENLNEIFDHDYITFTVEDFTGYFEIQQLEIE